MSINKNRGLGRGLSALFGGSDEEYEKAMSRGDNDGGARAASDNEQPIEIPLSKIDPNINQPRKRFDDATLSELTNSIRKQGVVQPITLVRRGDRYMIVVGERRYRASKKAGLVTIPAVVKDYTAQQISEIALIENLQRENLNPIEMANAFRQLMTDYGYTHEQVAERVDKSRPYITNALRLLDLSVPVVTFVAEGKLSPGHARCLVTVEDSETQFALAKKAVNDKISVRDLERMVKDCLTPKAAKPQVVQSIELKELVANMSRALGTKVSAFGSDNKGRIYIDYFTRDDLDRLVEIIEGISNKGGEV